MARSCADCKWCKYFVTKSGTTFMMCVNDVDGDGIEEVSYLSGEDCEGFEPDYPFEGEE